MILKLVKHKINTKDNRRRLWEHSKTRYDGGAIRKLPDKEAFMKKETLKNIREVP